MQQQCCLMAQVHMYSHSLLYEHKVGCGTVQGSMQSHQICTHVKYLKIILILELKIATNYGSFQILIFKKSQ